MPPTYGLPSIYFRNWVKPQQLVGHKRANFYTSIAHVATIKHLRSIFILSSELGRRVSPLCEQVATQEEWKNSLYKFLRKSL